MSRLAISLHRLLLSLIPILLISLAGHAAFAAGIAFVLNSGSASVSVIDMTTQKEVRRIPVLREPHHLALSPDGKSLLVGDTVGNEVLFLDPMNGRVQKRLPVADPYQLGFSPDGRFLVVNGLARNQVDVYDAASMQLLKRFPVVATPSHLAFAPDSGTVYVTLQDSNRLVAIDLHKMAVTWDEPVGKTPAGVMWHDGTLLVADMGTDHLAQVDPANGKVLAHIRTGKGAHNLFLSPDHKIIWVNNRAGGSTVSLNAATLQPIREYKISGGPDDLDFAPDGRIWITRRWAEKVAVLDPATGVYQNISVGRSPHGIFLNPKAPSPTPMLSSR
ncbi:MAG TPA: beta-propeller fold lactonase family protein [Acetobacteraceae bacterium]|nr:beta-propeller fold lactonase family protein [Acetobacteraceae bacterium]